MLYNLPEGCLCLSDLSFACSMVGSFRPSYGFWNNPAKPCQPRVARNVTLILDWVSGPCRPRILGTPALAKWRATSDGPVGCWGSDLGWTRDGFCFFRCNEFSESCCWSLKVATGLIDVAGLVGLRLEGRSQLWLQLTQLGGSVARQICCGTKGRREAS